MGRAFYGCLIDETIDHVIVTFANNFFALTFTYNSHPFSPISPQHIRGLK
jgi:hypothetical protein